MNSSGVLTSTQEKILLDYQTITNILDRNKAVAGLRRNNWNVESAVREFLDNGEQNDDSQGQTFTSRNKPEIDRVRVGNHQEHTGDTITSVVSFPVTLVWGVLGGLATLLCSLLEPPTRLTTQSEIRNPCIAAQKFIQEFEENYGEVRPEFFVGGYTEALSCAKRDVRHLLVILLSDGPKKSCAFCKNTLGSERLVNFLSDQEVIVWGGDVRESEGCEVSKILQARTFPFIGLIGFQPAPNNSLNMSMIEKIQGQATPETIIQKLINQVQRTSTVLQRIKKEHQERDASRNIREQQDEAYRLSLLADQEKERKAREQGECIKREMLKMEAIEKAKAKFESDRLRYRQYLITTLPKEPSLKEPNTTRLSFRMANGERVIRRFRGDEKVRDVYAFVDTLACTIDKKLEPVASNLDPEYMHEYSFLLVSPFPRTVIKLDSNDLKIRDIPGLWPSANLLVEHLDPERC